MKKIVAVVATVLVFVLCPSAYADYVCKVTYNPNSGTAGSYGSVTIFRHSERDCGGVFVGSSIFCSKNADYGPCANATYQYTERGLLALYRSLADAARDNTRITVVGNWCINGGFGCGAYVDIHGD